MDTTRDIIYRLFVLNDEDIEASIVPGGGSGSGLTGCVVDTFDMSDVDVVQWSEKRAQGDGSDAGDVFLGTRRIRMSGTLYALTRDALFDDLFSLRAALNPVLAQREEPLDYGYRPLYFSVPTARAADYPSGEIDLMVYALPRSLQHVSKDDSQGGDDDDALAIPWQASFVCKDPGIYAAASVSVTIDASTTSLIHLVDVDRTWYNRGTYLSGFNAIFVVGSGAGTITGNVGDSTFIITVAASSGVRTIRVKADKTITFEEADVEEPEMGAIAFTGDTTWPLIDPGDTPYNFAFTGGDWVQAGGSIWFDEQYA